MKVIRQFNNNILAESARIVLCGENIEAIVMGDNLSISGGPEFGLNYVQLAIVNDDEYEFAENILLENGLK